VIDIIVLRHAGDKPGEDIVDSLLSTLEAALARGAYELDKYDDGQQPVTLSITYRPNVRLGQLVEVHDSLQGRSYRGKITSVSHRISRGEATTTVDILKGAEYF